MANLLRWNPFTKLGSPSVWDDSIERFMRQALRPTLMNIDEALDIALDVSEGDGAFLVKAEVPGVRREDINVSIDGNQVSISTEVKKEREEKKGDKVLCSERFHGRMYRSFTLPTEVDQSKAEAKYTDGVLELVLPKKAGSGTKKLEVQ